MAALRPTRHRGQPTLGARIGGTVRLLHPFPSVLNAVVAGALAWFAHGGWPGAARLLPLVATMLAIQCAIGALNDWADASLDAAVKPAKPIAAGLVSRRFALGVALGLAGVASLLAATGGWKGWALAMAGLGTGFAYDLGVKRTPFSALSYALALPLVPVWVWTAVGRESPALAGVIPIGLLLGFGLQLANALPDAAGDEAGGVRGTLQWLGAVRGRWLAWSAFGSALLVALLLAPVLSLRWWPFLACWSVSGGLLALAVGAYRVAPGVRSLQLGWSLLAPAAGLLAVGWLGSIP